MSARRKVPKVGTYLHYTSADNGHLGSILASGVLRTTESNLSFAKEHAGPDVVWLLADRLRAGDRHGLITPTSGDYKTHVQIEVALPKAEVALWASWAKEQGISDEDFAVMVHSGGGLPQALRWRVIERPIPREEWVSITYLPLGLTIPVTAPDTPPEVLADFVTRYDAARGGTRV